MDMINTVEMAVGWWQEDQSVEEAYNDMFGYDAWDDDWQTAGDAIEL